MNFIEDGGYRRPELWLSAGWDEQPGNGALAQAFGDVWEWARGEYGPYPGFKPATGAVGEYNGKFMCNQYVLRGGPCATPQSHIRPTTGISSRPMFSGLRLARDP